MTQATNTQCQQVRLRQACDACTTSKVKCDRGRPACQRCLDGDQFCGYSASRRYGKRSRHANKAGTQRRRASSSTTETPAVLPQSIEMETDHYLASLYGDVGWDNSISQTTVAKTVPPYQLRNELSITGDPNSTKLPDLDCVNCAPSCNQWMEQSDFSWAIDEVQQPPNVAASVSSFSINEQVLARERNCRDIEHALACEARAINVLRSLHYSPALYSSTSNSSRSGSSNASTVSSTAYRSTSAVETMETLLVTNKTALGDLTQMLECRCAENPHVALLHMTILNKVMFWYRVAVTAEYHSERVSLEPMKIQLGMLDLDDDDHASLHRAALLRELHKAGSVIKVFETRSAIREGPVSTKVFPWGRLAIRAVGEELERIVQETGGDHERRR